MDNTHIKNHRKCKNAHSTTAGGSPDFGRMGCPKRRNHRKMIFSVLAGMMIIPGNVLHAAAAEQQEGEPFVQVSGIESILESCYETEVKEKINLYLVPTDEGEYLNIAFSDTGDFTYIRSAPDENSDWVGKLYADSSAQVLEYLDGWTKIKSGQAQGYVPSETLYTGEEARQQAESYETDMIAVTADVLNVRSGQGTDNEILGQIRYGEQYETAGEPVNGWYPVIVGSTQGWVSGEYIIEETVYSYGETREEEEARLLSEEVSEQQEAVTEESEALETAVNPSLTGQAVTDYACQFIGNPYVWGGTSLTQGADCSGFVQSVYAHFGITLPRTTYEMVNSGYEVSYEEALPGDLILYDGHVGIYMGDGTIVNAMNEEDGIGICSAVYTDILTVRRVI